MQKSLLLIAFWLFFGFLFQAFAQKESNYDLTLRELYNQHPEIFESLFSSLDLTHPGLEEVKKHLLAGI